MKISLLGPTAQKNTKEPPDERIKGCHGFQMLIAFNPSIPSIK